MYLSKVAVSDWAGDARLDSNGLSSCRYEVRQTRQRKISARLMYQKDS